LFISELTNLFMSSKIEGDTLERLVPILLFASIGLAFIVGILWQKVSNLESGKVSGETTTTQAQIQDTTNTKISLELIKDLFKKEVIKFGDEKRKVLFVEVSDTSCPYCQVASGKNSEVNKQLGDRFTLVADGGTYIAPVVEMKKLVDEGKASFVYIYQNGHGNGEMGAKALYCAFEKSKFWEVHDLLMTREGYDLVNNVVKNDKTKSEELSKFLEGAINKDELKSCLDSGKYDERISQDIALARSIGADGTPGFYINDQFYGGAFGWKDNNVDLQTRNQVPDSSMEIVVNRLLGK
jgi:protein-disulfide isomerase